MCPYSSRNRGRMCRVQYASVLGKTLVLPAMELQHAVIPCFATKLGRFKHGRKPTGLRPATASDFQQSPVIADHHLSKDDRRSQAAAKNNQGILQSLMVIRHHQLLRSVMMRSTQAFNWRDFVLYSSNHPDNPDSPTCDWGQPVNSF
jgi:hypothetical protein